MTARGLLARTTFLCAVTALTACTTASHNSRYAADAPPAASTFVQPQITPSSAALAEVTNALSLTVRQIDVTVPPSDRLLASADIQPRTVWINRNLQCVPFARERSGVAIRGNANTWWKQAAGDFVRVKAPAVGAVIVMQTRRGHVGVVTKIVDSRHIIIDHANWLSNGQIYLDQPVMDVSANNDWSKVVVWHPNLGKFGKRALAVSGFIVDAPANGNATVFASLESVPSALTANIQFAAVSAPKAAPLPESAPEAPAAEAPVLVADAGAPVTPSAKPASIAPDAVPAATMVAAAEAQPVYVDTIVPGAKPGRLTAPEAPVAVADASPVLVDTIVPGAKPSNLGATAVAVVAKGETSGTATAVEAAFVPTGKPASVAAFR